MTERDNSEAVTAALIIIGNEILSGRTQDVNLAYVATRLGEVGVQLAEVRVVPDVAGEIIHAVNRLRAKFDYVFTTGGIGPTHDDITAECVARAFDRPLLLNPQAHAILKRHYDRLEVEMNEARLRMAHTPEGAILIDNPVSAAPGFRVENVHVMAGVPKIMQAMLDGILPTLRGGAKVQSRTIVCNLPEGEVAAGLGALQQTWPAIDMGSYPSFATGDFRVSLVLRGTDKAALDAAAEAVQRMISDLGGDWREN